MVEVQFHPEAAAEYETALGWYLARSAQAADRFEIEVERILNLIAVNPVLFPLYQDDHRFAMLWLAMLRRFPFSLVD